MSLTLHDVLHRAFKAALDVELELLEIWIGPDRYALTPAYTLDMSKGRIVEVHYKYRYKDQDPDLIPLHNLQDTQREVFKMVSEYLNERHHGLPANVSIVVRESREKEPDCYLVKQNQRNLFERMTPEKYLETHRIGY